MNPARRAFVAAAAALASTGCFQMAAVLKVNGDGSGTIEYRTLFTPAGLMQLRQLSSLGGRGEPIDPTSEETTRLIAGSFGPGVTYVTSVPIESADGRGREATFAFSDVSQLRVQQQPVPPGSTSWSAPAFRTDENIAFSLTRQPGGPATLRIRMPQPNLAAFPATAAGGAMLNAEQLGALRKMFAGAAMTIAVEPAGRLIRTNSPFVADQRITLLDVDLDLLLTEETLLRFQRVKTAEDLTAFIKAASGLKLTLEPEIVVEFAPR
jgi:hypothetical protein